MLEHHPSTIGQAGSSRESDKLARVSRKGLLGRLFKPIEEEDAERRRQLPERHECTRTDCVQPRTRVRLVGEITSITIVPRAASPALEVTIDDGHGKATGVFLGRRRIAGVTTGKKMLIEGLAQVERGRTLVYNPAYELL
jgi:RecG-like helicase